MLSVWETLRGWVLEDLRAAVQVDVVLLHLHGAMVPVGCDDCEGDLIVRVREIVGPNTVIGVELDLHCHLTKTMVSEADAIVLYKEYPHVDLTQRAAELFEICISAAEGAVRPVMALHDCRMLGVWRTSDPEVRALVDEMSEAERRPGLSPSVSAMDFNGATSPASAQKCCRPCENSSRLMDATTERAGRRFSRVSG